MQRFEERDPRGAMAGGALLDVGVYPLMACTDLLKRHAS